jgi:ATP-dependent helicase HrpB
LAIRFDPFPIEEVLPELKEKLHKNTTVILQAPPGAGKSTILPINLLNEVWLQGKKILMLEPRRLAARSVANRMADLLNDPIGEQVGYRVRFENRVGPKTRIEVVTEGILIRMLQNNNALENVGLVIFDEFHERSLNTDVSLALCLQIQQILREDLRILIMSATLDSQSLQAVLKNAPVVTSEGRNFPVAIKYLNTNQEELLVTRMAKAVWQAFSEQQGDLLAFLPGAGEIQKVGTLLGGHSGFVLHYLYGDLPLQKQQEALTPDNRGRRKIILATSIAETSLTIQGITTVVDSGYARIPRFDPKSGLSRLETVRITQDAAGQRAGRAGRLGPGVCYRLWNEGLHSNLLPKRDPEMLDADLSSMLLELSQWGITSIEDLIWITKPPAGALLQARELLQKLEAIDGNTITNKGKEMLQLPTHPRIAHMLMEAVKYDEGKNTNYYKVMATDLAALLEEKDPMAKEAGADISLRLELLRKWRNKDFISSDKNVLERIERLALQWRKIFKISEDNTMAVAQDIGRLLAAAYPERIARLIDVKNSRYRLANGRMVKLQSHDLLTGTAWIAIAHMDAGTHEGKIYLAAPLDPVDISHMAEDREVLTWDFNKGVLVAVLEKRIGNITIASKPLGKIPEVLRVKILCEAIRESGLQMLPWTEDAESLKARVMSLRIWRPQEDWPDIRPALLLETLETWLGPYLIGFSKLSDFKQLKIKEILTGMLSYEQQGVLEKLAPSGLPVPSGSTIGLRYFEEGSTPEMSVRLQEVFGLTETPAVNGGTKKIILHLLSPGYKPVQVTRDLKSFWHNTYPAVRKELRIRYQKHHWPEDPWTAEAVKGTKKNLTGKK